jgi:RNA polymerase sigma-70 factor (ECF subfamily)
MLAFWSGMTFKAPVDLEHDEDSLIKRSIARDNDAFKLLYEKHVARVYAICLRYSGNEDEASDIAQEVFIQVWEKLKNFRGESAFSTWLHRITTNISISYIRKRSPWWARSIEWSKAGNEEQLKVTETYFEHSLDKKIADLPKQARLVFVLFAIDGYRHAEIAQILKISPGTSKAQYHRARQLLKEKLKYD